MKMGIVTQFLRFERQDSTSVPILELELLQNILEQGKNQKLLIVSSCGSARQGKTFILNFILRSILKQAEDEDDFLNWDRPDQPLEGFAWANGEDQVTQGMWITNEPTILKNSSEQEMAVFLIDTQGIFDEYSTPEESRIILCISLLLSATTLFSMTAEFNEEKIAALASTIDFFQSKFPIQKFGGLMLLIKDWTVKLDYTHGEHGGSKYLNKRLTISPNHSQESKHARTVIREHLPEINAFLFPHPGEKSSNDNFTGSLNEILPKFSKELETFLWSPKLLNLDFARETYSTILDELKSVVAVFKPASSNESKSNDSLLQELQVINGENSADSEKSSLNDSAENIHPEQMVKSLASEYTSKLKKRISESEGVMTSAELTQLHNQLYESVIAKFQPDSIYGYKKCRGHLETLEKLLGATFETIENEMKAARRTIEERLDVTSADVISEYEEQLKEIHCTWTTGLKVGRSTSLKAKKVAEEAIHQFISKSSTFNQDLVKQKEQRLKNLLKQAFDKHIDQLRENEDKKQFVEFEYRKLELVTEYKENMNKLLPMAYPESRLDIHNKCVAFMLTKFTFLKPAYEDILKEAFEQEYQKIVQTIPIPIGDDRLKSVVLCAGDLKQQSGRLSSAISTRVEEDVANVTEMEAARRNIETILDEIFVNILSEYQEQMKKIGCTWTGDKVSRSTSLEAKQIADEAVRQFLSKSARYKADLVYEKQQRLKVLLKQAFDEHIEQQQEIEEKKQDAEFEMQKLEFVDEYRARLKKLLPNADPQKRRDIHSRCVAFMFTKITSRKAAHEEDLKQAFEQEYKNMTQSIKITEFEKDCLEIVNQCAVQSMTACDENIGQHSDPQSCVTSRSIEVERATLTEAYEMYRSKIEGFLKNFQYNAQEHLNQTELQTFCNTSRDESIIYIERKITGDSLKNALEQFKTKCNEENGDYETKMNETYKLCTAQFAAFKDSIKNEFITRVYGFQETVKSETELRNKYASVRDELLQRFWKEGVKFRLHVHDAYDSLKNELVAHFINTVLKHFQLRRQHSLVEAQPLVRIVAPFSSQEMRKQYREMTQTMPKSRGLRRFYRRTARSCSELNLQQEAENRTTSTIHIPKLGVEMNKQPTILTEATSLEATAVGIHFGRYNIRCSAFKDSKFIHVPLEKESTVLPCYIGINSDDKIVFGEEAQRTIEYYVNHGLKISEMAIGQTYNLHSKHGKMISVCFEEAVALVLKYIYEVASKYLKGILKLSVITVPSLCDHTYRKGMLDATELAGIQNVNLVSECSAAISKYIHQFPTRFGSNVTVLVAYHSGKNDLEAGYFKITSSSSMQKSVLGKFYDKPGDRKLASFLSATALHKFVYDTDNDEFSEIVNNAFTGANTKDLDVIVSVGDGVQGRLLKVKMDKDCSTVDLVTGVLEGTAYYAQSLTTKCPNLLQECLPYELQYEYLGRDYVALHKFTAYPLETSVILNYTNNQNETIIKLNAYYSKEFVIHTQTVCVSTIRSAKFDMVEFNLKLDTQGILCIIAEVVESGNRKNRRPVNVNVVFDKNKNFLQMEKCKQNLEEIIQQYQ